VIVDNKSEVAILPMNMVLNAILSWGIALVIVGAITCFSR
jgi:hypothetical protein